MSVRVYSARIGCSSPDALDITRKSGRGEALAFAPSWAILRPALDARKRAEATGTPAIADRILAAAWTAYVPAYLNEMRASWRRNRPAWDALLARPSVTLLCYCTDAEHCHRRILRAVILPKLGATDCGEVGARAMTPDTYAALARLAFAEADPKPADEFNDVPTPTTSEARRLRELGQRLAKRASDSAAPRAAEERKHGE